MHASTGSGAVDGPDDGLLAVQDGADQLLPASLDQSGGLALGAVGRTFGAGARGTLVAQVGTSAEGAIAGSREHDAAHGEVV